MSALWKGRDDQKQPGTTYEIVAHVDLIGTCLYRHYHASRIYLMARTSFHYFLSLQVVTGTMTFWVRAITEASMRSRACSSARSVTRGLRAPRAYQTTKLCTTARQRAQFVARSSQPEATLTDTPKLPTQKQLYPDIFDI